MEVVGVAGIEPIEEPEAPPAPVREDIEPAEEVFEIILAGWCETGFAEQKSQKVSVLMVKKVFGAAVRSVRVFPREKNRAFFPNLIIALSLIFSLCDIYVAADEHNE